MFFLTYIKVSLKEEKRGGKGEKRGKIILNGMNLCIVGPFSPQSGNETTAHRLANIFTCSPIVSSCRIIDSREPCPTPPNNNNHTLLLYDVCFVIHAVKGAGYIWPMDVFSNGGNACMLPCREYILILGGTDINEHIKLPSHREYMFNVVFPRVRKLVCFSQEMMGRLQEELLGTRYYSPQFRDKCIVIPQSVALPQIVMAQEIEKEKGLLLEEEVKRELNGLQSLLSLQQEVKVVLLCGGLREVKGQNFAIDAWRCKKKRDPPAEVLLLLGPPLEEGMTEMVQKAAVCDSSIIWHSGLSRSALFAWMLVSGRLSSCAGSTALEGNRRNGTTMKSVAANVVRLTTSSSISLPRIAMMINTSMSEGQPQCVLEAMLCGIPVVVRSIPGNTAVVSHQVTGLVSSSVSELSSDISLVLGFSDANANELCSKALKYVLDAHSEEQECEKYHSLLRDLNQ